MRIKNGKDALIEVGFIKAYYRIIEVMESNIGSENFIKKETSARRWGLGVLERPVKFAKRKHPKIERNIDEESYWYFNEISEKHGKMLDNYFEELRNGNKQEKTDDCN
jgi:hypothetical protein